MTTKPKVIKNKNMRTIAPIKFTKEGLERVKQEYNELQETRKAIVTRVQIAREMGDLSENAAYHAARQELFAADKRLRLLKMQMIYGVVDESASDDVVHLGSTVVVNDGAEEKTFTIVGAFEADPLSGKLSEKSPIGAALLGKKVGDKADITIPSGTVHYTVVTIS